MEKNTEGYYKEDCASCWSSSRTCITMYGSENVEFAFSFSAEVGQLFHFHLYEFPSFLIQDFPLIL